MELRSYFAIFRRRFWLILLTALVALLGALAINYLETPSYTSSVTVRIATVGSGVAGERSDINLSDRVMSTYARIVTGGSVRSQITQQLGLTERPGITAETIPGTELLRVQATASSAQIANDIANAAAQILIDQGREIYGGSGRSTLDIVAAQIDQVEAELATARDEYEELLSAPNADPQQLSAANQLIELKERTYSTLLDQYERVRINQALLSNTVSVVEPAYVPTAPSKPRTTVNLVIGLLFGFFAGLMIALLAENLDTKLYTTSQIQAVAKLPTVGQIPVFHDRSSPIAAMSSQNGNRPQFEAFRLLRINLLSWQNDQSHHRAFLVTSADVGEGKSTVVANLAVTFARSGRKVVVVDCNMHRPALHTIFSVPNEYGLTTVLTEQASVAGVVQPTKIPNVNVMTIGPILPNLATLPVPAAIVPQGLAKRLDQESELLGSREMAAVIEQLRQDYDIVLLDTPALLSVMDAAVLAPLVDHVVLVVERAHAHRDALRAVTERLHYVQANSIGLIINRAEDPTQVNYKRKPESA